MTRWTPQQVRGDKCEEIKEEILKRSATSKICFTEKIGFKNMPPMKLSSPGSEKLEGAEKIRFLNLANNLAIQGFFSDMGDRNILNKTKTNFSSSTSNLATTASNSPKKKSKSYSGDLSSLFIDLLLYNMGSLDSAEDPVQQTISPKRTSTASPNKPTQVRDKAKWKMVDISTARKMVSNFLLGDEEYEISITKVAGEGEEVGDITLKKNGEALEEINKELAEKLIADLRIVLEKDAKHLKKIKATDVDSKARIAKIESLIDLEGRKWQDRVDNLLKPKIPVTKTTTSDHVDTGVVVLSPSLKTTTASTSGNISDVSSDDESDSEVITNEQEIFNSISQVNNSNNPPKLTIHDSKIPVIVGKGFGSTVSMVVQTTTGTPTRIPIAINSELRNRFTTSHLDLEEDSDKNSNEELQFSNQNGNNSADDSVMITSSRSSPTTLHEEGSQDGGKKLEVGDQSVNSSDNSVARAEGLLKIRQRILNRAEKNRLDKEKQKALAAKDEVDYNITNAVQEVTNKSTTEELHDLYHIVVASQIKDDVDNAKTTGQKFYLSNEQQDVDISGLFQNRLIPKVLEDFSKCETSNKYMEALRLSLKNVDLGNIDEDKQYHFFSGDSVKYIKIDDSTIQATHDNKFIYDDGNKEILTPAKEKVEEYAEFLGVTEKYLENVKLLEWEKVLPDATEQVVENTAIPSPSPQAPVAEKIADTTLYKPVTIGDGIWKDKERGNKLKVVNGVYGVKGEDDQNAIEQTLFDIITQVAATQEPPLDLKRVLEIISKARAQGGIKNEWVGGDNGHYNPTDPVDKVAKKFSRDFQKECEACGILSGRGTSSRGLRTTFIPLSVTQELEKLGKGEKSHFLEGELDGDKIKVSQRVKENLEKRENSVKQIAQSHEH